NGSNFGMLSTTFPRQINNALHHVKLKDGHHIAVVRCDDQSFGISFDGKLIASIRWDADDLETCVDVFENFVFMHAGPRDEGEKPIDEQGPTNRLGSAPGLHRRGWRRDWRGSLLERKTGCHPERQADFAVGVAGR